MRQDHNGIRERTVQGRSAARRLTVALACLLAAVVAPSALAVPVTIAPEDRTSGDPLTEFRFLINEDNAGDPADPNPLLHPGYKPMASFTPTVALGDASNATGVDLEPGRYLVSISAPGYKFWGQHFTVEPGTPQEVAVSMLPTPLPLGKLQISIFQDNVSVNAAPDIGEPGGPITETGMAGFRVILEDNVGEVSVDYYNNPLCTRYQRNPDGTFVLDSDGIPIPIPGTGGDCLTNANGELTIEQLPPDRYHIIVIPPDGSGWIQTSTFEGKPDIDFSVVTEGDDGFGAIGEAQLEPLTLPTSYWFGFVKRCTFGNPADACPDNASGNKTITGRARTWVGWPPFDNLVVGEPVRRPWIALSNLGGTPSGDERQVYTARGNANGTFTIPNVPPGTYQLSIWDQPLDYIIRFATVVVEPGDTVIALGDIGVARWFGWVSGHVFEDTGLNGAGLPIPGAAADSGIRDCDPADSTSCELGIPQSDLDIRYRDGSVKSASFTNNQGEYEFAEEISPLFKFEILEVGFGRYARTGHSIFDEIKVNHPDADADGDGIPNGSDPDLADPIVLPTDLGGGLLLNQLTVEGHRSVVDFGKREYAPDDPITPAYDGENGGIAGIVFHATTRNELDARLQANEDYEPGIGGAVVRLWGLGADGEPNTADDPLLNELQTDEWSHPRSDDPDLPQECDIRDVNHVEQPDAVPAVKPFCTEVALLGNETKAGAFDGGFQFESSCDTPIEAGDLVGGVPADEYTGLLSEAPGVTLENCTDVLTPGDYVVQGMTPDLFQVVKEEDINVNDGADFVPAIPPAPCVGDLHTVDVADVAVDGYPATATAPASTPVVNPAFAEGTLYDPDGGSPYEGQERPLCTKRLVTVQDQQNPEANFFFFTENGVELPGRIFGLVTDDINFETDPTNPHYGEPRAVPNVPVSVRDFTGRLITTLATDEFGFYEVVLPSTDTANCPNPAGICPGTYVFTINDPGDPSDPNEPDPVTGMCAHGCFNPNYVTTPLALEIWPGKMTPADTPLDPISALTCGQHGITENTFVPIPEFFTVSQPYGPTGTEITIRGTDFGATQGTGSVTLDGTAQAVGSWSDDAIDVTLAGAPGPHQLLVTADSGKTTRSGITFHVLGAGYDPPVVTVGPVDPADQPPADSGLPLLTPIQDAIDAAAPGSLIVIEPGSYRENVILHKRVKLQGHGPGGLLPAPVTEQREFAVDDPATQVQGTVVDGRFFDYVPNREAWLALLGSLAFDGPASVPEGADLTVVASDGEFDADPAFNPQVDGLALVLGQGTGAGAIQVHAFARGLEVTNIVMEGNGGLASGAIGLGSILLGDLQNDGISVRYNRFLGNGVGQNGAGGGIGIFNGANGYEISNNELCANFSGQYGGAIGHRGRSPGGEIADNVIYFNDAFDEGGAIFVGGEPSMDPSALGAGTGAVDIVRNTITGNLSQDDGGGIRLLETLQAPVNVVNNIVAYNVAADFGGGIALDDAVNVRIVNDTVAYNMSTATSEDRDVSCGTPSPLFVSCPHAAGLVSEPNEPLLQATLPPGSPVFSDPVLFNNIFWGNEAFIWDPDVVVDGGPNTGSLVTQGCFDFEVFGTLTPQFFSPRESIISVDYPSVGTTDPTNIVGAGCSAAGDPANAPDSENFPVFVLLPEVGVEIAPNQLNPGEPLVTMIRNDPLPFGEDGLPGDFHLADGSPAIDQGVAADGHLAVPTSAPFDDIDSDVRPMGVTWDLGADEVLGDPPDPVDPDPEFPPEIEGGAEVEVGALLAATTGNFTGTPPLIFAFQWQRSNLAATTWTNISGAAGDVYTVTAADASRMLRVRVTARNAGGLYEATATSAPVHVLGLPQGPPRLRAVRASVNGHRVTATATTRDCAPCRVELRLRFSGSWHTYRMKKTSGPAALGETTQWSKTVRNIPSGKRKWYVRIVDLDRSLQARSSAKKVRVR